MKLSLTSIQTQTKANLKIKDDIKMTYSPFPFQSYTDLWISQQQLSCLLLPLPNNTWLSTGVNTNVCEL